MNYSPHHLRILEGEEEAKVIAQVREIIAQKPKVRGVDHWERGWNENLSAYMATRDVDALKPKYIRPGLPLRFNGKFVMADDPDLEWLAYRELLAEISDRWLIDVCAIAEFGSGSGHNLAWLKMRHPEKSIIGFDWSPSAVAIARAVADEGQIFDMAHPPPVGKLALNNAAVLTVGAMEQLGAAWWPFLNFLLVAKPKLVVHLEPVLDFYDPSNPVDQTAIEAHKARGFWEGYLDELRRLEDVGRLRIEHTERSRFGSLLIEGYSQIIFAPT